MLRKIIGFRPILVVLSSLFLILSFPNFNLVFFAWVGLVPLLFAIDGQKPLKSFITAYIAGVLFFLGTVYWLIHVTLPGMIIVVLYLALYFGLFGILVSCIFRTPSARRGPEGEGGCPAYNTPRSCLITLYIPAAWVVTEFIRSHFLTGFGWAILAHSQARNLPFIQIADITGACGVSFLVVMVNTALFVTIRNFRGKNYSTLHILIVLLILFLSVSYGTFRLKNIFTGERLRVAVVQGNIPQSKKWDCDFKEEILEKYWSLTKKAASLGTDLIIWPETSVPGFLDSEKGLEEKVASLAREVKTPLLVGAPAGDKNLKDVYYNSAFLFSSEGRLIGRHDKIHLVPFGEYVPAKGIFSFVQNFASSPIGDFTAGKARTVFRFPVSRNWRDGAAAWKFLKKVKFSCLICFEDIFAGLTGEFVRGGADFLVNITNDAWFGDSSAPFQHAQSSVFRAVENRVNVVRAANTGFSCFINQKGQIIGAVESGGRNLFVDGIAVREITLTRTRTFYSVFGDIFVFMCLLSMFFIFIYFKISRPQS